jgi:hypothetical protein
LRNFCRAILERESAAANASDDAGMTVLLAGVEKKNRKKKQDKS